MNCSKKKARFLFIFMNVLVKKLNYLIPKGDKNVLDIMFSNITVDVALVTDHLVSPNASHDFLSIYITAKEIVSSNAVRHTSYF